MFSRIEVSSPAAAEAVSRNCSRCSQGLAQVTISCYFLSGDDNCSVHPRVVATHVLVCVRHCERVLVGGIPVHVSRVKATSPRRPDGRSDCVRRSSRQNLGHLSVVILTIGHSTHALENFLEILRAHGVTRLVDIRTIPRSRRNPQFNQDLLSESLKHSAIDYVLIKQLGGLRHPKADSSNMGWRNSSFRGFADYMQTQEFATGLDQLIGLAQNSQAAIMCAEVLPWRCHRWLIADALLVRGVQVEHIMTIKTRTKHSMTKFALVKDSQVTYPESPA